MFQRAAERVAQTAGRSVAEEEEEEEALTARCTCCHRTEARARVEDDGVLTSVGTVGHYQELLGRLRLKPVPPNSSEGDE
eukprot:1879479-Prymnesium_polylepis.1